MTTTGGEGIGMQQTNQAPVVQTVVVVQQPVGQAPTVPQQANGDINRYPRWAYLVFSIGFFAYHFVWGWIWLILSFAPDGYGVLFFFCGCVPSLTFWIMMICDSTVFCANGDTRTDPVTRICCCSCANGFAMMIPVAIGM